MKQLAIIGAGALGQQIAQHILQSRAYDRVGFLDDTMPVGTVTAHGLVLGGVPDTGRLYQAGQFDEVLLGIGYHHLAAREKLFTRWSAEVPFSRFVHPTAYVDSSVELGPGAFISPGCVLDLNVSLDDNVFLYPGCIVAHDAVLGAHSLLAPGVRMAGHVRIGRRNFLGIGTTLIDSVTTSDDVRTGAGAVVTRSLTEPGTYVGIPARLLQKEA